MIFSDYEGNEYVAERRYNSKKHLSHTVNFEITKYQVQKTNVNKLKDKLGKIKKPLYGTKIFPIK